MRPSTSAHVHDGPRIAKRRFNMLGEAGVRTAGPSISTADQVIPSLGQGHDPIRAAGKPGTTLRWLQDGLPASHTRRLDMQSGIQVLEQTQPDGLATSPCHDKPEWPSSTVSNKLTMRSNSVEYTWILRIRSGAG